MPYLSQFNLPPEVSVGNIALETVPNPEELFKGADQAFTSILDNVFGLALFWYIAGYLASLLQKR